MITLEKFNLIKEKYGCYSSWAVWADEGDKPKSNVCYLSVLDPIINNALFAQLKPDIVLVGLNISRPLGENYINFHDSRPKANDYKLRFALRGTNYYGAYITDVIKNLEETKSPKVMNQLNKDPELELKNINVFKEEMKFVCDKNPQIIAMGNSVWEILSRHFPKTEIKKIPHYSSHINKEKYREVVREILSN